MRKDDLFTIRPHRHFGFKCGMNVRYNGESCLFLGYISNFDGIIADRSGNKKTVKLGMLNKG